MKKLLTICLVIATSFSSKAQEMNFEETVKYINEKIQCCGENRDLVFSAKKDGTISYFRQTFNLFDLFTNNEYPNGIYISNTDITVRLSEKSWTDFTSFKMLKDTERVYNALLHLKSLCTKTKDPFDK